MWPTWLNYLISNTRRCCTQSGTFAFSLFVQIRERGDVVKWQLSPQFSSVFHLRRGGKKTDKQVVSSSVSYFSFLQLTAPKSQVWLELDSSLYQVTQHPPSLHSSISTWPTQPLFPFISLRAGFISGCPSVFELRCNQSPCPPLYSACSLSLKQTAQALSWCLFLFIIVPFLFLPQPFLNLFFFLSVNKTLSACLCSFCCAAHCSIKAFVGLPPLWCGETEMHKDKLELCGAGSHDVTVHSERSVSSCCCWGAS